MKKSILRILTFSVIALIGALIIGCAGKKDFTPYTNEYGATLTAVNLTLDVSEIEVKKNDGDKIILHYYDTAENFYSVNEENGAFIFLNQILQKNFQKPLDKACPLW